MLLFPLMTEFSYSGYSRRENKQVSAFKIQYIYIKWQSLSIVCSYTWGEKNPFQMLSLIFIFATLNRANHSSQPSTEYSWIYLGFWKDVWAYRFITHGFQQCFSWAGMADSCHMLQLPEPCNCRLYSMLRHRSTFLLPLRKILSSPENEIIYKSETVRIMLAKQESGALLLLQFFYILK